MVYFFADQQVEYIVFLSHYFNFLKINNLCLVTLHTSL